MSASLSLVKSMWSLFHLTTYIIGKRLILSIKDKRRAIRGYKNVLGGKKAIFIQLENFIDATIYQSIPFLKSQSGMVTLRQIPQQALETEHDGFIILFPRLCYPSNS